MDETRRLHFKSIPLILLSVILGPLGNVLLGKGMKGSDAIARVPSGIAETIFTAFRSPFLWLGIACLLGFFLIHMLLLTWADYSYVQPATSLSYATVAVLSYLVLGEAISSLRALGIAVICLGVFIVGRTHPNSANLP